jgi:hypothetical protein
VSPSHVHWQFPQPLRGYESFALLDETPQYPMTFVIELQLSGELHREALESAYRDTLALHPLLTARVERSRWHASRWVPAESPPPLNWTAAHDPPLQDPGPIDIAAEPGVRLWALADPRSPRLLLQFHHAATDGLGSLQFIGDLLARYGRLTARPGEAIPEPAPVHIDRLHERETLWPTPAFRSRFLRRSLRRAWEQWRQRPCQVAGRRDNWPLQAAPYPAYHTRVLDAGQVLALKSQAAGRLATLSDLATLAYWRTLRDWSERHARCDPRHVWRLSVPVSLRLPQHDDSPAANHLSLMLLARRGAELDDDAAVLSYLRRAREACLGSCEGRMFTYWAGGLARNWPWLYRLGAGRGEYCSAILANIGDVRRHLRGRFPLDRGRIVAGSVRLEALLGAACVRHGARVAASFGTYAGQMFLNLNVDPAYLDRAAGDELADSLVSHLLRLLAAGTAAVQSRAA